MEGNKGFVFVAQLLLVDMQVTISCMDPMGTTNGCFVTEFPHSSSAPSQRNQCQFLIRSWRHVGVGLLWGKPKCHFSGQEATAAGWNRKMHWCTPGCHQLDVFTQDTNSVAATCKPDRIQWGWPEGVQASRGSGMVTGPRRQTSSGH